MAPRNKADMFIPIALTLESHLAEVAHFRRVPAIDTSISISIHELPQDSSRSLITPSPNYTTSRAVIGFRRNISSQ